MLTVSHEQTEWFIKERGYKWDESGERLVRPICLTLSGVDVRGKGWTRHISIGQFNYWVSDIDEVGRVRDRRVVA